MLKRIAAHPRLPPPLTDGVDRKQAQVSSLPSLCGVQEVLAHTQGVLVRGAPRSGQVATQTICCCSFSGGRRQKPLPWVTPRHAQQNNVGERESIGAQCGSRPAPRGNQKKVGRSLPVDRQPHRTLNLWYGLHLSDAGGQTIGWNNNIKTTMINTCHVS